MTSLAQVGVLYVYIMLILLVIGFGYALSRLTSGLIQWANKKKNENNTNTGKARNDDAPWIRLAFVSASVLFISIFSLGVLKTIGVGEDHHSGQTAQPFTQNPMTYNGGQNPNLYYLQSQIDLMTYQLYNMEQLLKRGN